MLAAKTKSEWINKFAKNSALITNTVFQKSIEPSNKINKKHLELSHLYQIVFDAIQNIPVSTQILTEASKKNSSVDVSISVSLFDLESSSFFGKTWHSPQAIPLIRKIDKDNADSKSCDEKIDNQRAHLIGNKLVLQLKNQVGKFNIVRLFSYKSPKPTYHCCGRNYYTL